MNIKILLIEDDSTLGSLVQETLTRVGYQVEWLKDGNIAMMMYHKTKPNICIFDVMLPKISGIEIAKNIRTVDEDIPIIFLTAKTQLNDVLEGFKAGANDYIKKPFSLEELIARIESLLKLKKIKSGISNSANEYIIQSYIFNLSKQILSSPKSEYKLSYKETEILKLLAINKGFIIKREDILTQVWGTVSFFNGRILDVYISKLRNYFKEDTTIEIITIRGIGYKLVC